MRNARVALAIVLGCLLQLTQISRASAAEDGRVKAWLQATYDRITLATDKGDLQGIFAYDAPSCQYAGLDGSRLTREQLMELVRRSIAAPPSASGKTKDTVTAVDLQKETAVVTLDGIVTGQVTNPRSGAVQTVEERYTARDTWIHSEGGWQRVLSQIVSANARLVGGPQPASTGFAPGRPGTGPRWPHTAQEAIGATHSFVDPLARSFMGTLDRADYAAAYGLLTQEARAACPSERFVPFVRGLHERMGRFQAQTLYDVASYPSAATGGSVIVGTYVARFERGDAVLEFAAEKGPQCWSVVSFKYYAPASGKAPEFPWTPMVNRFLQDISKGADQDAFSSLMVSGAVGPALDSFKALSTHLRQVLGPFQALHAVYAGPPGNGAAFPEGSEKYLCEARFERGPAFLVFTVTPGSGGTWSIASFQAYSPLFLQQLSAPTP